MKRRVVWSSAGELAFTRPRATRRRRMARATTRLTLLGLLWLARAMRPRWRPLLGGVVCTIAGVILRNGEWSLLLLPGLLMLAYAPLIPAAADADHRRLERELAAYSTPAERDDLEATLANYPDGATRDLREILARTPYARQVRR
jgi:hypothetical protein